MRLVWSAAGFLLGVSVPAAAQFGTLGTWSDITQFPVEPVNPGSGQITVGPDQALWFTFDTERIAHITTSGEVRTFIVTPCLC